MGKSNCPAAFAMAVRCAANYVRASSAGVTTTVKHAAVPVVASTAGNDVDNRTGSSAVFRAVAVTQHLEFRDRFDRRIDQNRAVRTGVIIVRAVHQVQVVGGLVSVDGEVNTACRPLFLLSKLFAAETPGANCVN